MHLTSKVTDNQKSTAFLASSFGKWKNDFPGHLYRLFVQFIALHTSPSTCNFVAVDSIAHGDFHQNKVALASAVLHNMTI